MNGVGGSVIVKAVDTCAAAANRKRMTRRSDAIATVLGDEAAAIEDFHYAMVLMFVFSVLRCSILFFFNFTKKPLAAVRDKQGINLK